jgi:hypothetical protein
MPQPANRKIPLQIVFQGGGAKLCALMAAETLRERETHRGWSAALRLVKLPQSCFSSNDSITDFIRELCTAPR